MLRAGLLTAMLLPLLALGCKKGDGAKLAPVAGQVKIDGQPLAKAQVHFQPVPTKDGGSPGPDSYAFTDENGNFSLKANLADGTTADGAVVGPHTVQISVFDRDARPEPLERVPARYNAQTTLKFTVPEGGTKDANFLGLKGFKK
jgi:hypothetical protein